MEKRIRTKDLIKEIEEIKVKTKELKQIIEAMPVSSVKKAFEYSVKILETKIQNFTKVTERMVLSDEEKVLISKFREARAKGEEVSEVPASVEAEVPASVEVKKKKK